SLAKVYADLFYQPPLRIGEVRQPISEPQNLALTIHKQRQLVGNRIVEQRVCRSATGWINVTRMIQKTVSSLTGIQWDSLYFRVCHGRGCCLPKQILRGEIL